MNGSRCTFAFIMICFFIGGFTKVEASSDYNYISQLQLHKLSNVTSGGYVG